MGIFDWLRGSQAARPAIRITTQRDDASPATAAPSPRPGARGTYRRLDGCLTNSTGAYRVNAVGESYYQDDLWKIATAGASLRKRSIRVEKLAMLVSEPQNPHDPRAVGVYIDGQQVGHLSRQDAVSIGGFMPGGSLTGACNAAISGDSPSAGTPRPLLGVYLDL